MSAKKALPNRGNLLGYILKAGRRWLSEARKEYSKDLPAQAQQSQGDKRVLGVCWVLKALDPWQGDFTRMD